MNSEPSLFKFGGHPTGLYRKLFDTMAAGVVFVAPDGRFIQANPAAEAMLRMTASQIESQNCNDPAWEGIRPDGTPRPHEERAIQRAFKERRAVANVEMGVRRKDGTTIWINSTATPLINAAGELEGVVAAFVDISAQHETQDLVQLQRDLAVAILEQGNLNDAAQKLLEFVCRIPGVDAGGVYRVDGTTGQADLLVHRGLGAAFIAAVAHVEPRSHRALRLLEGRPIYVGGAALRKMDVDGALTQERVRALAVIPQHFEGRVVASLNVASHTVDDFSPATRTALESIAALMGGAIVRLDAQDAVRRSQRNMVTLLDTITDMLFILDETGRVLLTNHSTQQGLGYTAEELTRLSVFDLHPVDRRDEAVAIVAEMLAGRRETCVIPLVTRDGHLVEVETKAHFGQWDGRKVVFGVSRDISDRLRSEKAIIRANEDWERTFAAVPDLIALLDTDHRITRVNRALAERLGYTPEQAVGRLCYEVIHGLCDPPASCPYARLLASGRQEHAEVVEAHLGGVFDVTVAPLHNEAGCLVGSVHVAHDITESKRATQFLLESEAKYRELVENINDIIYSMDTQGVITYISPVVERMFGYAASDLVGASYQGYIHPDDLPGIQGSEAAIRAGVILASEYRLRARSGDYLWVWRSSRPILDAAGTVVGIRGVIRDINKRILVEQALIEKERALSQAQQIAHVGSWELDDATHVLQWSDETFRMFGYAPNAVEPTMELFRQSIHPADRDRLVAAVTAAWDAHAPFSEDHRIIRPDGTERIVHERGEIVLDDSGRPAKWMGTVQDITDARRAEELFRGVFEHNPTSIQILNKDGYTLKVNAAHTRLFGSVPPADFSIFDDLSRLPALRELVLHARRGNVTRLPDILYNAHDALPDFPDKPVWVRAIVFPINGDGDQSERFVLMHEDITEHKRMENEILQISDWEKTRIGQDLHDTLGQQFAGVAYLSQSLMSMWQMQPPANTNKAMVQLDVEARRAVELVRMLARGLTPVALGPNGLANALHGVAQRAQMIHGVSCVLHADATWEPTDRSTVTHLFYMTQESVTNALRHGQARHILIRLTGSEGHGELAIEDDGVGMPVHQPDGPGLGLRIMRYRAGQIGGTLAIERAEGGGTRVVCRFGRAT